MTHFEYIFVAVSIVLSFTLLRLLDSLPYVFSRARGYWVHAVWVSLLLFLCASYWWLSWSNRNLDGLSFRYFLFLLLTPCILYLAATALVSASPGQVPSWHQHFYRIRRRFFLGILAYVSMLLANSFITFGVPLEHPIRVAQAVMIGLFAAGALLPSERAQAILASVTAACLAWALLLAGWGRLSLSFE